MAGDISEFTGDQIRKQQIMDMQIRMWKVRLRRQAGCHNQTKHIESKCFSQPVLFVAADGLSGPSWPEQVFARRKRRRERFGHDIFSRDLLWMGGMLQETRGVVDIYRAILRSQGF